MGYRMERLFTGAAAALVSFGVAALVFSGVACAKARQYDIAPVPGRVQPIRLEPAGDLTPNAKDGTEYLIASADELGDEAEVERQLAYIRDHRADSLASYEQALIGANRLDEAARVLIGRLQDPSERIDALMETQGYKEFPLPSRALKIRWRWQSVIQRPDVRAAVERIGNVGSYAVIREVS